MNLEPETREDGGADLTENTKPSLADRTLHAALWLGLGRVGANVLHYLAYLVFALLLPPSDFGLLGLGLMFVIFVEGLGGLGLTAALIHKRNLDDETLGTAFWTSLAVSTGLAAFAFLTAGSVTTFLGDSRAAPILQALSLLFPMYALTSVPLALLERDLRFKAVSAQNVVGEIGYAGVGLSMAFLGFGVWSLIGAILAQRLGGIAVLWYAVDWRPKMRFDPKLLRDLLSFGAPVLASLTLQRGAANLDYFVVARWLGTEALGYYTLAFQLAIVPAQRLTGLAYRVLFPALAQVRRDATRLANGVREGLQHVFALLTPFCLAMVVLAPSFVEAVYDDKWLPSASSMQILAIGAFFSGLDFSQALFFAVGRPGLRALLVAIQVGTFILLLLIFGLVQGIESVAVYIACSLSLTAVASLLLMSRLIDGGLVPLASRIWPSLRAGMLALLPVLFLSGWRDYFSAATWLFVGGVPMLVVYLLAAPSYRVMLRRIVPGLNQRVRVANER